MVNAKLARVIAQALKIDPNAVTLELESGAIPQWDSLAHLTLFMQLESYYHVRFKTEEITQLLRVQQIQEALAQRGVL